MPWINDLASSAGIPAGAATLAVAMYAACAAAEKAARPQALQDIGRTLKDSVMGTICATVCNHRASVHVDVR